MNKTTVIYHSADFDGIFCKRIAQRFLGSATDYIGWNFGDAPLAPPEGLVYVLDLPCDAPFGGKWKQCKDGYWWLSDEGLPGPVPLEKFIWIDHHKSSIESHPPELPGCRIDGVAACRLAWQWFTAEARLVEQGSINREQITTYPFPQKQDFIDRKLAEPLAVRLAGEYDIWDKRDPNADIFQFALRAIDEEELPWELLFTAGSSHLLTDLLDKGKVIESYQRRMDAQIARSRTFDLDWEGLRFLAINALRCNSKSFEAAVGPDHDALLGFSTDGKGWTVSLYHAPQRRELDLSAIAVRYGGGGHKGACGFRCKELPFLRS